MRTGFAEGATDSSYSITDDFMFGTVFMDMELCKSLVEILLGIEVSDIRPIERQVRLDGGPLARAGVVDLLVRDGRGNAIDVEMQNVVRGDIVRRARYYQSLVDLVLLGPGEGFGQLRDQVVLFICSADPFGRGLKRYEALRTFKDNGQDLGDGTRMVFMNVEGWQGESTPELDALLRYFGDNSIIESDYVRRVDEAVRAHCNDPVWRRLRMLWSEKYRDDFAEARREGRQVGLEEGRAAGLELGRREGRAEGRRQGEAEALGRMASLTECLEEAGRGNEALRALRDPALRQRLLEEFGL